MSYENLVNSVKLQNGQHRAKPTRVGRCNDQAKAVHSSEWKRKTSHWDDEIVCSVQEYAAGLIAGVLLTTTPEHVG